MVGRAHIPKIIKMKIKRHLANEEAILGLLRGFGVGVEWSLLFFLTSGFLFVVFFLVPSPTDFFFLV